MKEQIIAEIEVFEKPLADIAENEGATTDPEIERALHLDATTLNHPTLLANLGDNGTNHQAVDLIAAVAWSSIIEPGDEFAGFIRQSLGAAKSLAMLVAGAGVREWAMAILQNDQIDEADQRFVNLEKTIQESLARWRPRVSLARVLSLLDCALANDIGLLTPRHSTWPKQLDALKYAAPPLLWVRGNRSVIQNSFASVAVVGSRAPSNYGFEVTSSLIQEFATAGITIVSGGAFGIDAMAHRAALAVETPTIAVMAGGLDRMYPRSNEELLRAVMSDGAVVSEVSPGTTPTKWRFLQRNRIIAALSQATVVVEAGYRSGAINTAKHANSLDRVVGAVPGGIFAPTSAGCNRLIADGVAKLVTRAADVLDFLELPGFDFALDAATVGANAQSGALSGAQSDADYLPPLETRVYDAIGFRALSLEGICFEAGVTTGEALQALGSLQLLGKVLNRGAKWVRA